MRPAIGRPPRRIPARTAGALEAWLIGLALASCACGMAGLWNARLWCAIALVALLAALLVEWNAEP